MGINMKDFEVPQPSYEKRHQYMVKDFLVPIIIGIILGGLTSLGVVKYNEGETNAWRASQEKRMAGLEIIMQAVQTNQIELAARGTWIIKTEEALADIRLRLNNIEEKRFTTADADIRTQAVLREIDILRKEVRRE